MKPSMLSVVIPTRQRPAILKLCLEHLAKQTMHKELDVIVVHDGQDDQETLPMLKELASVTATFSRFVYFAIPKAQQGVARNKGIERVQTPLTLFINDDILLTPEACERHVTAHKKIDTPTL